MKFKFNRYNIYTESFNNFVQLIRRYAPFYKQVFNTQFIEFKEICKKQGITYEVYVIEPLKDSEKDWMAELSRKEKKETRRDNPERIREIEKEIANSIRDYLYSLQEIN